MKVLANSEMQVNLYTLEILFIIIGWDTGLAQYYNNKCEMSRKRVNTYISPNLQIYRALYKFHTCIYFNMTYVEPNVKCKKIHMIWKSLFRRFQERNIVGVYFKTFRNMAERISISRQVEWQIGIAKRLSTFPSAFRVFTQTGIHIHQSLGVIEIGGNRSWCFPRLGHDGAQRKFYYGAPLSTSLDTTLFIIRGY